MIDSPLAVKKLTRLASNFNLDTYSGEWNYEKAAHLLRRTMFGASHDQIKEAVAAGMEATVDLLLTVSDAPPPPIYYDYDQDPNAGLGETWVNAPWMELDGIVNARRRSLYAWVFGTMYTEDVSITEKMTLFWHNHFVTQLQTVDDVVFMYKYVDLLRSSALGNFKQLTKDITVDPAMLRYLNGNQNTAANPNENYARELLELFTIGKGPSAGSGDYTTFTEHDVAEIAKILTGWRDFGFYHLDENNPPRSEYRSPRHDKSTKQLSHRFGNRVIENMEDQEYAHLIDVIFEQEEVSKFLCRKLYRWFVYHDISEEEETNVIAPMAEVLRNNDYNLTPALRQLFTSEHFYHDDNIGCIIKNPIDYLMDTFKKLEVPIPGDLLKNYEVWLQIAYLLEPLQMVYLNPPNVAGWKAFYQEPQYYRTWINSVTLPFRTQVTDFMTFVGFEAAGERIIINVLKIVEALDDPYDPNNMIDELAQILLPRPLVESQRTYLKEIIIPGLPDFEWTVEYSDFRSDPNNEDKRNAIDTKLKALFRAMMNMPEVYLS